MEPTPTPFRDRFLDSNYLLDGDVIAFWVAVISVIVAIAIPITIELLKWFSQWLKQKRLEKEVDQEAYTPQEITNSTRFYVRPTCSNVDPAQEAEISNIEPTSEDLFQYVDKFLSHEKERRHLIILADSGMGKTSFALNYYALNQRRWRNRKRLALVHLSKNNAIEQINRIQKKNETDLILDALDEDKLAIRDYRTRLKEIFRATESFRHIIITCRSQFFPRDDEIPKEIGIVRVGAVGLGENKHLELYKVYLTPLTNKQIRQYLSKRYPYISFRIIKNREERKKALSLIEKIPLLVARPMVLAYLPDLINDERSEEIQYSCQLYEIIVDKWLEREKKLAEKDESLSWANKEELLKFSEELAVDLYINQTKRSGDRISVDELEALSKKHGVQIEKWQLTGRSLLNRNAIGEYKFAHRSILEFLFIKRYFEQDERCQNIQWTDLMKQFLVEKLIHEQAVIEKSRYEFYDVYINDINLNGIDLSNISYEKFRPKQIKSNQIFFLNFNRCAFIKANFKDTLYYRPFWAFDCDFSNANFESADLSRTKFNHSDLTKANFRNCKLNNVDFTNTNLSDANLSNADLKGAKLREVTINENTKLNKKWRLVWEILNTSRNKDYRNADFNEADLSQAEFHNINFNNANFSDANLTMAEFTNCDLGNANFNNAALYGTELRHVKNLTADQLKTARINESTEVPPELEATKRQILQKK